MQMHSRFIRMAMLVVAATFFAIPPSRADFEQGQTAWYAGNIAEALEQWRFAAGGGDARSMLALGRLYRSGVGVLQDYVEAYTWLNLAAARGELDAARERDELAVTMTAQERAEGQWRAREWLARADEDSDAAEVAETAPSVSEVEPVNTAPPEAVREAQGLLATLGYEPGLVDGVWGARSVAAYGEFLRDAGLPASDTLTPQGLFAMRAISGHVRESPSDVLVDEETSSSQQALATDALHRAAKEGDIDGVEAALAAGADVNVRDSSGWTVLMHAVNEGYTLLVGPILEADPDLDIRAPDGATALFIAAVHGHDEIIDVLTEAGADISIMGPKGKSADEIVAVRTVSEKGYGGRHGLHRALRAGENVAVIKAILDSGADISARQEVKAGKYFALLTPLQTALSENASSDVVVLLLDHGAGLFENWMSKINSQDEPYSYRSSALHFARSVENIELLLTLGIDLHARDGRGATALHQAAFNNAVDAIELLLDLGVYVDSQQESGSTPLHYAASGDARAAAELLLDAGADIDARTSYDGSTPLHYTGAAVTELLINRGADIDAQNLGGETPLNVLAWSWDYREDPLVVAKLLLDAGADTNLRDTSGDTPLEQALLYEHLTLAHLIQEHEATSGSQKEQTNDAKQSLSKHDK